jgi:serine/threonine protein kinase
MKIIKQILSTFIYIHSCGIVHRDLKSHNVLVDEYYNIKLCDFGLAKYKSELSWGNGQFAGTPAYMAPELFMKKGFDEKIDIFAFGTLMWEILVRKIPYEGYEAVEIRNKVLADEKIVIPKTLPSHLADIIHLSRSNDPTKRPSFSELICMKFE